MAVQKPGAKNKGRTVTDAQQRIDLLLERNISVFELRYLKRAPYPKKLFGVDDVIVHIVENPNSHEIRYQVETRRGSDVEFTEDENNVLTAYLPDTEKNRRILAKTIFIAKWEIIALFTPEGIIPKTQIQQQIKELADKLGIEPPPDMRSHSQMLRDRQRQARLDKKTREAGGEPSAPPGPSPQPSAEKPAPVERTEPMTKEEAESTAFQRYEGLVALLEKKHGSHWKSSGEYKQVIKPEIDKLMGIVPGAKQDTQDTKESGKTQETQQLAEGNGKGERPWEKKPAGEDKGAPAQAPAGGSDGSIVG